MGRHLLGASLFYVGGLLYLLPALIAARRGHPDASRILIRNAFRGWAVLPWFECLLLALRPRTARRGPTPSVPREERAWAALPVATVPLRWNRGRAELS